MLDIKFIRENPEIVQNAIKNKRKAAQINVCDILNLDKEKVAIEKSIQDLSYKKNQNAKDARNVEEGKIIKENINKLGDRLKIVSSQLIDLLLKVPNIPSEDTPIGINDDDNKILKKVGNRPNFDFEPKPHDELGKTLGIINTEKASEVAGSRFNYLMGDGALLEYALANYAISVLTNQTLLSQIIKDNNLKVSDKPFMPVIPPNFINPETFLKMARLEPKEDRYYIESEKLYLIGSAEHTLGCIHMNEELDAEDLPKRYFANTSCYRKEAGTAGKDMRGILRQHQFDKVEMLSYSLPEKSLEEHKFFIAIQEYLVKSLGLPYQNVLLCTGEMGVPNVRHSDIEIWLPGQNKYRETHSADLNTDYQSRRLNIKTKIDGKKQLVHMNDGTAFALGRMIIAILENNQQKDGSVLVPSVLQQYMHKDVIKKQK